MKRNLLLIFGLIVLMSACKISNDEAPVVEIDPVFSIDMIQDLSEFGGLNIIVNSIELQDCENYSIAAEWDRTATKIDLSLIEIMPPSDCISGNALAESIIELGNIGNNRTFGLNISLQNLVENKGQLIINNKSYTIEMESLDGLGYVRTELMKVPSTAVWGYIAYENETTAGVLSEEFLNDIESSGEEMILEEGYYGHFNINANNKIATINPPSVQFIKPFLISYNGTMEALENLVTNYKNGANGNEVEIKVKVWNGEEF